MSKSTRNRPLDHAKRSKILNAAIDLFLNQGLENVTMTDVSEKAGVAKQTVYSHFTNKENLFQQAMLHAMDGHLLGQLAPDLNAPTEKFLADFAYMMVMALTSDEGLKIQRIMTNINPTSLELREIYWENGPMAIQNMLAEYFKNKTKLGDINVIDPDSAAQQFYYMLKARANAKALLGLNNKQEENKLKKYAKSCVEFFLRGHR